MESKFILNFGMCNMLLMIMLLYSFMDSMDLISVCFPFGNCTVVCLEMILLLTGGFLDTWSVVLLLMIYVLFVFMSENLVFEVLMKELVLFVFLWSSVMIWLYFFLVSCFVCFVFVLEVVSELVDFFFFGLICLLWNLCLSGNLWSKK